MTFGERLRKLRKDKGFTQAELGKLLGLAESTISLYESNRNKPDTDILTKISEIFGVTVDFLLGKESKKEEERGMLVIGDKYIPAVRLLSKLPENKLKAIEEILKSMVERDD